MTVLCGCGRDYLAVPFDGKAHDCPAPRAPLAEVVQMPSGCMVRLEWDDLVGSKPAPGSVLQRIVFAAADAFSVGAADIVAHDRRPRVVEARCACVYLARRLTDLSLPELGRALDGRHHASILAALHRAQDAMGTDPAFAETVDEVETAVADRAEIGAAA